MESFYLDLPTPYSVNLIIIKEKSRFSLRPDNAGRRRQRERESE